MSTVKIWVSKLFYFYSIFISIFILFYLFYFYSSSKLFLFFVRFLNPPMCDCPIHSFKSSTYDQIHCKAAFYRKNRYFHKNHSASRRWSVLQNAESQYLRTYVYVVIVNFRIRVRQVRWSARSRLAHRILHPKASDWLCRFYRTRPPSSASWCYPAIIFLKLLLTWGCGTGKDEGMRKENVESL